MRSEVLGRVVVDLLSVPPLIFCLIRRKLVMTNLADTDVDIKLLHLEIMRLLQEEGTLRPAKIGERLLIAKAQMTHLIDKLVELDFVKRETDPKDRRTLNITITEKGKRVLEEQDNLVIGTVRDNMDSLNDDELEALPDSSRNLRDTLFRLQ